jgi:hypothetical protein
MEQGAQHNAIRLAGLCIDVADFNAVTVDFTVRGFAV